LEIERPAVDAPAPAWLRFPAAPRRFDSKGTAAPSSMAWGWDGQESRRTFSSAAEPWDETPQDRWPELPVTTEMDHEELVAAAHREILRRQQLNHEQEGMAWNEWRF
jgi:hypothetical protein